MTHELKKIFEYYRKAKKDGLRAVLASVVYLEGSSYRKPGVRMLVLSNGAMVGAVSGGCVEKEVQRQSQEVFEKGRPKIMTYDGRYRLGCEGVLYILLEPFNPSNQLLAVFDDCVDKRNSFELASYYSKKEGANINIGSYIRFSKKEKHPISDNVHPLNIGQDESLYTFREMMPPCFRLLIIGTEHDAVKLCLLASLTGWEVTVISSPDSIKTINDFPGAKAVMQLSDDISIDKHTAVVLMTHNYADDLNYLIKLKDAVPVYIGLLGPIKRREKLLSALIERYPGVTESFLECIHGPAGLNIGSETPEEIAISIISEILSVSRNKEPMRLRSNDIHTQVEFS